MKLVLEDRILLGKEKVKLPPLKEKINKGIAMQAVAAEYDPQHQKLLAHRHRNKLNQPGDIFRRMGQCGKVRTCAMNLYLGR